jgi:hypothetical protein
LRATEFNLDDIKNEKSTTKGIHHGKKVISTELGASKFLFLRIIRTIKRTKGIEIPNENNLVQKLPNHTCSRVDEIENPELLKSILPRKNCDITTANKMEDGSMSCEKTFVSLSSVSWERRRFDIKKSAKAMSRPTIIVSELGSVPKPNLDCNETLYELPDLFDKLLRMNSERPRVIK